jgi:uncharacterized membrane protein YkoI
MKALNRVVLGLAAAGFLIAAPLTHAATDSPAALQAQAKVSEADARTSALARVPNGTIKSSELEMEHRRLVWSFDIANPASKGITEVQVDAKTGKIVSVKKETAAQEAKEASSTASPAK